MKSMQQQPQHHLPVDLPVDLDETVHRCLGAGFDGTSGVPHTLKRLIGRGLGGVILFTRNVRDADQVRRILGDLLRHDPGFDGVLVSDALEMKAIADRYGEAAGARLALAAGADQVIVAVPDLATTLACRDAVIGALRDGTLTEERVREAAGRVRKMAERYAGAVGEGAVGPWDAGAGLEAARRAVRGALRGARAGGFTAAPGAYVVDLFPPPHPAPNWGAEDLLSEVRALDPTAAGMALNEAPVDPAALVEGILRWAAGVPLVVATSDAGLSPWQGQLRAGLAAGRGDAVLVDTGLPDGEGALCSYGRERANLRALAEVLVGGV
ncbi:glycoside hydrolase family 3 N-terminal domain-containing protein [Streptomyces sp. ADMS]|uniref:glycoside hydrolase family 3 N-terminal domain-containing protein n=1 Tax=Streptomyces sp. ADMS TaxID=3071415 RepID=UPI00296E3234|nr:glycoside hydrolase family 3 N-terminal domain-containing protein [Streptomyces sp. ADMS]MDW4908985.1 glycoside hydrolase family 3 N-terminal domain-containing protein [Streptomyces sp. ADMS]